VFFSRSETVDAFFYSFFLYVLPWESLLLRGKGRDLIYRSNPASFVGLSQTMVWISDVICRGLYCVQFRWEVIVVLMILVELRTFPVNSFFS